MKFIKNNNKNSYLQLIIIISYLGILCYI